MAAVILSAGAANVYFTMAGRLNGILATGGAIAVAALLVPLDAWRTAAGSFGRGLGMAVGTMLGPKIAALVFAAAALVLGFYWMYPPRIGEIQPRAFVPGF